MSYTSQKTTFQTYTNGTSPYIKDGYWYIGNTDTKIKAEGADALTMLLSNDSDIIVRNNLGAIVGDLPTTDVFVLRGATPVEGANITLTPPDGFVQGVEGEEGVDTHYTFDGKKLTINNLPEGFTAGAFTFEYADTGISKTFPLKVVSSEVDYNLVIDKTLINSTKEGGTVKITVKKISADGTKILEKPYDESKDEEENKNSEKGVQLRINDDEDYANRWFIRYDIGETDAITVKLEVQVGNESIVWDEETIEFVANGTPGGDGDSLQVIYIAYEPTKENPTPPDPPTGWDESMPTLSKRQRMYMSQKMSKSTTWSAPVQISAEDGLPGKDGKDIEYVYYRTDVIENNLSAPDANTTINDVPNNITDEHKKAWYKSPLGITEKYPYEYMSMRTKSAGAENWGNYTTPVIWSKWGDKGQDGDGVVYHYCRMQDTSIPLYPAPSNLTYNWTDEPQGVSSDYPYEYVVTIATSSKEKEEKEEEMAKRVDAATQKRSMADWKDAAERKTYICNIRKNANNSHIEIGDYVYVEGIVLDLSESSIRLYGEVVSLYNPNQYDGWIQMQNMRLSYREGVLWAKFGEDSVAYWLQRSTPIIAKKADGTYQTDSVLFTPMKQIGSKTPEVCTADEVVVNIYTESVEEGDDVTPEPDENGVYTISLGDESSGKVSVAEALCAQMILIGKESNPDVKVDEETVEVLADGVTIKDVKYGTSNSYSTEPTNFGTNYPTDITPGQWIWTRTYYSNGVTADLKTYYSQDNITASLTNDYDLVVKNNAGVLVSSFPITSTIELYQGSQKLTPTSYLWSGPNGFEDDVATLSLEASDYNTYGPGSYVGTAKHNNTTLYTKTFTIAETTAEVDYNLIVPSTVNVGTTNNQKTKTVAVQVLKIGKGYSDDTSASATLQSAGDHLIKIEYKVADSETWETLGSWDSLPISKKTQVRIRSTVTDDSSLVWDEETIEVVMSGDNGTGTNGDTSEMVYVYQKITRARDENGNIINLTPPKTPEISSKDYFTDNSDWKLYEITSSDSDDFVFRSTGIKKTSGANSDNITYSSWTIPELYSAFIDKNVSGEKAAAFYKLFGYGDAEKQGIKYDGEGNAYINATMINTGILTVTKGGNGNDKNDVLFSAGWNNDGTGSVKIGAMEVSQLASKSDVASVAAGNLLFESEKIENWYFSNESGTKTAEDGWVEVSLQASGGNDSNGLFEQYIWLYGNNNDTPNVNAIDLEAGTYVLSWEAKGSCPSIGHQVLILNDGWGEDVSNMLFSTEKNEWKHFSFNFTVPEGGWTKTIIRFDCNTADNDVMYDLSVRKVQLQVGDTATAWKKPQKPVGMSDNVSTNDFSWKFSSTEGMFMWDGPQGTISTENPTGDAIFAVYKNDNKKTLYMKGRVEAESGNIGGWTIGNKGIYAKWTGTEADEEPDGELGTVGMYYGTKWTVGEDENESPVRFYAGKSGNTAKFVVTEDGQVYASNAQIDAAGFTINGDPPSTLETNYKNLADECSKAYDAIDSIQGDINNLYGFIGNENLTGEWQYDDRE